MALMSTCDFAGVINIGPVQPPPEEAIIPFLDIEKTASGVTLGPEEFDAPLDAAGHAAPDQASSTQSVDGSKLNCIICKQVAEWAIQKLKDNRTEEAIVNALDQVCDKIFSASQRPQCETFVKQYSDEIISVLKQENDPELICTLLGVCSATHTNNVPKTDEGNLDSALCDNCMQASEIERFFVSQRNIIDSSCCTHLAVLRSSTQLYMTQNRLSEN